MAKPLFLPLGTSRHKSETWFHIQVGNDVMTYRPSQAWGLAFLFGLVPDVDHWRASFPSQYYHGRKIDTAAACAYIHRLCINAGEYKPYESTSNDGEPSR